MTTEQEMRWFVEAVAHEAPPGPALTSERGTAVVQHRGMVLVSAFAVVIVALGVVAAISVVRPAADDVGDADTSGLVEGAGPSPAFDTSILGIEMVSERITDEDANLNGTAFNDTTEWIGAIDRGPILVGLTDGWVGVTMSGKDANIEVCQSLVFTEDRFGSSTCSPTHVDIHLLRAQVGLHTAEMVTTTDPAVSVIGVVIQAPNGETTRYWQRAHAGSAVFVWPRFNPGTETTVTTYDTAGEVLAERDTLSPEPEPSALQLDVTYIPASAVSVPELAVANTGDTAADLSRWTITTPEYDDRALVLPGGTWLDPGASLFVYQWQRTADECPPPVGPIPGNERQNWYFVLCYDPPSDEPFDRFPGGEINLINRAGVIVDEFVPDG